MGIYIHCVNVHLTQIMDLLLLKEEPATYNRMSMVLFNIKQKVLLLVDCNVHGVPLQMCFIY